MPTKILPTATINHPQQISGRYAEMHRENHRNASLLALRAKPFIKWVGGKQAIATTLVDYFPSDFQTYYEPFIGGGSVFLTLLPNEAIICDQNIWLIDTYLAIRDDWERVASILDSLKNTKEEYLKIRCIPHVQLDLFRKAAHFIYLNKTGFRGLFRVNKSGGFNVPYGEYDRRYYDPENLEAVSATLQNVEVRTGDFEQGISGITKEDFVYLDPPYHKLGGYSDFNRYTELKFYEKDQSRLASICQKLDAKGIRWALSNSDTALIRDLYGTFNIHTIENRREINLNSQSRNITELLITNY